MTPRTLHFAALEQVIEPADAIPPITVRLENDAMAAIGGRLAVVVGQKVDEDVLAGICTARLELHRAHLSAEVMQAQNRIVTPVVAQGEDIVAGSAQNREVAPTDLRDLSAHADQSLCPVQERIGVAPLVGHIDPFVTVRTTRNDSCDGPRVLGKTSMGFGGPLHRRARTFTFWQAQIVTHADFIAVSEYGGSRQRQHQAVSEFNTTPVAGEHRRNPSADASFV